MMSLETIRAMSDEQAEKAAKDNSTPNVPFNADDVNRMPGGDNWNGRRGFPFPNIGNYVPDGWVDTGESFFVDSSGFGADNESALTYQQLNRELMKLVEIHRGKRRVGYAISEVGQFQLVVSVYEREIVGEKESTRLKDQFDEFVSFPPSVPGGFLRKVD